MTDWKSSMIQSFEYYIVDPITWKNISKIDNVISSTINWDLNAETIGSATININGDINECYIRIYLIIIQNDIKEKFPLGTFLVQTPSYKFDGRIQSTTLDAYTPLLELKENYPPLGYSVMKDENIMDIAYRLTRENVRPPVIKTTNTQVVTDNFIANTDETWLNFISYLLESANYNFGLDELGRILFLPKQNIQSLQPVWTYNDDNSSILYPDLNIDRDLYGIPNVVEVIYSKGTTYYYGVAINDDPNSPLSTINRGRKITKRVTNPTITGRPSRQEIENHAKQLLKELSTLEYTVTYTHGYCPVRIGDCVRLNYSRAGLRNVKAKVINQSIDCVPGCPVTEKAVFTTELWGW